MGRSLLKRPIPPASASIPRLCKAFPTGNWLKTRGTRSINLVEKHSPPPPGHSPPSPFANDEEWLMEMEKRPFPGGREVGERGMLAGPPENLQLLTSRK